MSYKIVTCSTCDYTPEMSEWNNLVSVPLQLQVGDYITMDDENFNKAEFVKRVDEYEGVAKSACPSIESWLKAFEGDEDEIFVVTITSSLSGTYNSALQAVSVYLEENGDKKKIHVFDGKAASSKNTMIVMKIRELKENGATFDEVVEKIPKYIDGIKLYFLLDNLETLRKNGRLSSLQAFLLKELRVKLICGEKDGNIAKVSQDISISRAQNKLAKIISKQLDDIDTSKMTMICSECFCEDRAKELIEKSTVGKECKRKEVVSMRGLNTLYAGVGGLIIAFDTYFI